MQIKYKVRVFFVCQNGANIHSSVPTSLHYLATNLYTTVVDLIYFHRLIELALNLLEKFTVAWVLVQ